MNPYYLLAQGLEMTFSLFKVGKAAGIGEKVAALGGKAGRAKVAAKFGDFVDNAGDVIGAGIGAGAKGTVKGANVGTKYAAKATKWWNETGKGKYWGGAKVKGEEAYGYLTGTKKGQRLAAGLVSGGIGYATADQDASFTDRVGRGIGFGIAGGWAMGRYQSPKFAKDMGKVVDNLSHATQKGRIAQAGRRLGSALGIPKEWGYKQSMMLGGMYGLMSNHTSVAEGVFMGATMHFGGKRLYGTKGEYAGSRLGIARYKREGVYGTDMMSKLRETYKDKGILAAIQKAPAFRTAVYGGMMMGAYNSSDNSTFGTSVLGGAIMGGVKGVAVGGVAKAFMKAPTTSIAVGLGGLTYAGSVMEGANTFFGAGMPGFDSLNADGDLALSLHRMRHG